MAMAQAVCLLVVTCLSAQIPLFTSTCAATTKNRRLQPTTYTVPSTTTEGDLTGRKIIPSGQNGTVACPLESSLRIQNVSFFALPNRHTDRSGSPKVSTCSTGRFAEAVREACDNQDECLLPGSNVIPPACIGRPLLVNYMCLQPSADDEPMDIAALPTELLPT
ncbi:hypothetical protein RvY_11938-2 [Ramazzottius varieornatus]|uniref:SUEL-type lectin domain-containing protein n=1 Tax=Ramazzottius varieornatus TaxID=947166 RepID=A0A1D1VRK8_RAMVA|nr:hypothetical protein RvY_11938-2 [Ramazzottius varieornatus]